jgi:hypothetical protein
MRECPTLTCASNPTAEIFGLNPIQCGFESHEAYSMGA